MSCHLTIIPPPIDCLLTEETAPRVQPGDVLRFHDGRLVASVTDIREWPLNFRTDAPGLEGRYYHFGYWTFVGRPDEDGWMRHRGGPNPVPGRLVDIILRDRPDPQESDEESDFDGTMISDECDWSHDGGDRDIMFFRFHRPTPLPSLVDTDRVSLLVTQRMRDAARRSDKTLNDWISSIIHEASHR